MILTLLIELYSDIKALFSDLHHAKSYWAVAFVAVMIIGLMAVDAWVIFG